MKKTNLNIQRFEFLENNDFPIVDNREQSYDTAFWWMRTGDKSLFFLNVWEIMQVFFEKLEFLILTYKWSTIFERISKTNANLQKATMTKDVAIHFWISHSDFIHCIRNNFDEFEFSVKDKYSEAYYKHIY